MNDGVFFIVITSFGRRIARPFLRRKERKKKTRDDFARNRIPFLARLCLLCAHNKETAPLIPNKKKKKTRRRCEFDLLMLPGYTSFNFIQQIKVDVMSDTNDDSRPFVIIL